MDRFGKGGKNRSPADLFFSSTGLRNRDERRRVAG